MSNIKIYLDETTRDFQFDGLIHQEYGFFQYVGVSRNCEGSNLNITKIVERIKKNRNLTKTIKQLQEVYTENYYYGMYCEGSLVQIANYLKRDFDYKSEDVLEELINLVYTEALSSEVIDLFRILAPHAKLKAFDSKGYCQGDVVSVLTEVSQDEVDNYLWATPFELIIDDNEVVSGIYDLEDFKVFLPEQYSNQNLQKYIIN